MRRSPAILLLATLLAGCSVQLADAPVADRGAARTKANPATKAAPAPEADEVAKDGEAPATTAGAAPGTVAGASKGKPTLGGLTFKELAPENARYAGGAGGAMPASTGGMMAPAPAGMPMAKGPMGMPAQPEGLTSGNMNGGYGYAYGYGPGFGSSEPTTLVSLTQSEAAGSKGPYKAMMDAVIGPVIKDWAADAKLLSSNASTGSDGLLAEASPPPSDMPPGCEPYYMGEEMGWRLTFYSKSQGEMLNFYVTPKKTLVVRARWAPLDLAAVPVGVDNDVAVRSLVQAIETKGAKGEEEKTGLDYFMGGPFGGIVCDMPMSGPMPSYGPEMMGEYRTEAVYDVPDNARWNVNLQVILGKPVWELSYYAPHEEPRRMPMPTKVMDNGGGLVGMPEYEDPGYNFNNSAHGLVDAATGAVIRFSRPSKHYYPRPVAYPSPYPGQYPGGPYPTPAPSYSAPPPTAAPVAVAPTATPTPSMQ